MTLLSPRLSRLSLRPLAALALLTGFLTSTQAAPVAPPPTLENKAFIVMDFDSGRVLAESNADVPLPPASIAIASQIWDEINYPNLIANILPTRERANLILTKGSQHAIEQVRLRK